MRKRVRQIIACLMVAIMTLAMGVTVFAEETGGTGGENASKTKTYSITVSAEDSHEYSIYQIFTGDFSSNEDGTSKTLSNVKWGKNGKEETGTAVSDEILTELENLVGSDASDILKKIEEYADLNGTAYKTGITNEDPATGVPGGYYLIKDTTDVAETDDTVNLYVAAVADDVVVEVKTDKPESEKKVKDINDSTDATESEWQDSADWDIGDEVPFKLEAKLGSDYANYTHGYMLTFHDVQSAGLTFNADTVKVYIDGVELSGNYTVVEDPTDGCTFEIHFPNLKEISSVEAGTVIRVEYTATLNADAVIGSKGNPNTSHITFTNDANSTDLKEEGETPDDKVIVFTYKTVVNKVDEEGAPLTGAEFALEKKQADGSWKALTFVKNDEGTTFTFTGLDDGTYRITETTTPAGYNSIDPIEFTVTAEHEITSDDPRLTNFAVSSDAEFTTGFEAGVVKANDCVVSTDVVNSKGTILPSTGGIGTTIFTVVGLVIMAGAVILLVIRRKKA